MDCLCGDSWSLPGLVAGADFRDLEHGHDAIHVDLCRHAARVALLAALDLRWHAYACTSSELPRAHVAKPQPAPSCDNT